MRKTLCIAAGLLAAAIVTPVPGQDWSGSSVAARQLGSDTFVAGALVNVDEPVRGDLLAAGRQVEVNAAVAGDAVAAGGELSVSAPV